MNKLKILVFGAGAIGTYIGGSLALAGHHVVFLEQPGAVEELSKRGLFLEIANRQKKTIEIPVTAFGVTATLPEAINLGPFDFGIFALKSFDTAAFVHGLNGFADQMPVILCLSNGVDNEPALESILGPGKVIAGTVTSSIARSAVGNITLERLRGVGIADGNPLSLCLWEAFDQAGLNPHLYPRAADMKWSKMLTNLTVNASVAILEMKPREVLSHPALFRMEIDMLREALAVMKAQGLRVIDTPKTPVRLLAFAARLPATVSRPVMVKAVGGGRGGKMPSFYIDLHAGRGNSEVEWLNGAVARFGERFKVSTPVNKGLTEILSGLTRGQIPMTEYQRQPDKLLAKLYG